MELRVASNFASFDAPGVELPGFPGLPLPVAPPDESPGSTRFLHLPALPAMELRVASNPSSFSVPGAQTSGLPSVCFPVTPADDLTGFPGAIVFRLCRRWIRELPRVSHPSALPGPKLWISPRLRSSGCASRWVHGFPRAPHLPALPQVGLSSLPEFPLPWLRVMGLPSFLSLRTLRPYRPCVFGFPRILHLRLG